MKRYTRSVVRQIARKHSEEGEGAASRGAVAESRSRVLSLRKPPEKRMLTFRRRTSTRVFVPRKAVASKELGEVNCLTRVLQSGKRLRLSDLVEKTEDIKSGELADVRWFETSGNEKTRLSMPFVPTSDGNEMSMPEVQGFEKMFINVYSRKRRRNLSCDGLNSSSSVDVGQANDSRFKIVFSRKSENKKQKVTNGFCKVSDYQFGETEFFRARLRHNRLQLSELKKNLLETSDINESELCTSHSDQLVLVVLSESSSDDSLHRFGRFLLSTISWMRRARLSVPCFTAFLLSEPMGNAFLQHGIHFSPVADRNQKILLGSSISNFGTCKIYSSCEFLPLVSLNFLALPSYFKSLYLTVLLSSQYIHSPISMHPIVSNMRLYPDLQCDDLDSHVHMETDYSETMLSSSLSAALSKKAPSAAQTSSVVACGTGVVRGSRLRKLKKRRSLVKHSSARRFSSRNRHRTSTASQNGDILDDPSNFNGNKVISTPVSRSRLTKVTKRNQGLKMKEIKAALSDIKQNIDSVQCNTKILVTAGDRCWREEGAVVALELSSSGEWCLAVKIGNDLKYLHRPQDMKYTLNRFTHAHMWIVDDSWRLEFPEKWDWLTFKELHAECCQRNNHPEDASVKVIPVPVFKGIPACEDDRLSGFERPEQYICMKHDDEILRASLSEVPYYDMDSGDEKWLQKHNSNTSAIENSTCSYLSEGTFERMMFTFEKNAYYSSSNEIFSERELNSFEELGNKDMVADVYDYWLKKRKQKHGPLVRVFQGPSLRKPLLMQRQVLRKRRSLKKQRSHVGRGNPACWFNSKAKQEAEAEALLRVHEAENAWRRSVEAAVPLRHRAQLLMENADLAAYKSVMALRIAEALRSLPAELSSSFLDWLPDELRRN